MRANGYGADLEIDGHRVVIHLGRAAKMAAGTATIEIPTSDITDVKYKSASLLTNGEIRFKVDSNDLRSYGTDQPNHMTSGSLVVHWTRKGEADFAAIYDAIQSALVR